MRVGYQSFTKLDNTIWTSSLDELESLVFSATQLASVYAQVKYTW